MGIKNSLPSWQNQAMVPIFSQINQIQTSHSMYLRLILILSLHLRLDIPNAFFASDVSHQTPVCISLLSHVLLVSLPSIWTLKNITNSANHEDPILSIQLPPAPYYFIQIYKYPSQLPVLKHLQSFFLPSRERPNLTPRHIYTININHVYLKAPHLTLPRKHRPSETSLFFVPNVS
jgi:hypothetical protein